MPKTYLTQADREAARKRRQMDVLSKALQHCKVDTGREDRETARLIGVHPTTFCSWKKAPETITVDKLLDLVKLTGMSKEDFLKFGGFAS